MIIVAVECFQKINKDFILAVVDNHLIDYPTPINITWAWSFGLLASICLGIQLITGIFLAMHYTPHVDLAFASVEHIMRDVNNGWLIRYIHANGASMFFIIVYSHMFRGNRQQNVCFSIIFICSVVIGNRT